MPDSAKNESAPNYPQADEAKDLHEKEMDHKEGNTKGPTGNPVHPNPHPHHPTK